ncbi:hypothetical protein OG883_45735 [Streptomyces sp. NBC_01142]|uniref:hypothetical protein n=1 Tax=Streptomyces sp. NBC_01142 TaxID=2975865 RepID=UPI002258D0ED|nr:hypothetical protein [Streptomyces sp. NBC_01142]MCX4826942.1 hypothetical protein [Streptomyces sp. NBC_01142]
MGPEPDPVGALSPPVAGLAGVERAEFDTQRLVLEEVVHAGAAEALRRWMVLEDGQRHLAVIAADPQTPGGVRELSAGMLVRAVLEDKEPAPGQPQLTVLLSEWLYLRNARAPQGLELGWVTAAAAWALHMRDFTPFPPPGIVARALASSGEQGLATEALIEESAASVCNLLARAQLPYRSRDELVADWRTLDAMAANVPVLAESTLWLLDEMALRDVHAQQLRAILEPDITDHLTDRLTSTRLGDQRGYPPLDPQRTALLQQARQAVRAYTAAAHGGQPRAAQQLLDAFPVPARALEVPGPAAAWREVSSTAQQAAGRLADQRALAFEETSASYLADPELLNATRGYLDTRQAQLQVVHDALGRLNDGPAPVPGLLPAELADAAAGLSVLRVTEAFGTTARARQALDGQIAYQKQRPASPPWRLPRDLEVVRLQTVRDRLDQLPGESPALDERDIHQRVRAVMTRTTPAAPAVSLPPLRRPAAADPRHSHPHQLTSLPTPGLQP